MEDRSHHQHKIVVMGAGYGSLQYVVVGESCHLVAKVEVLKQFRSHLGSRAADNLLEVVQGSSCEAGMGEGVVEEVVLGVNISKAVVMESGHKVQVEVHKDYPENLCGPTWEDLLFFALDIQDSLGYFRSL